jgi:crossover junction endodeoxyribonuclease RuvC
MNSLLSIDPSLCGTGYCVMDKLGKILAYGEIQTKSTMVIQDRLLLIYKNIDNIITEYKVSEVVLEKMFINMNGQSSMNIAAVRGVLLLLCAQHKLKVIEVLATTIRRVIAGKGNVPKSHMTKCVLNLVDAETQLGNSSHNVIDAIASALYYIKLFSNVE